MTLTSAGKPSFAGLPRTAPGWWAVWLALGFFCFMGLLYALIAAGQTGGRHFWSNPLLACTLLSAAASATAGGVVALVALIRWRERSILLLLAVLLAGFVVFFGVAEMTVPH